MKLPLSDVVSFAAPSTTSYTLSGWLSWYPSAHALQLRNRLLNIRAININKLYKTQSALTCSKFRTKCEICSKLTIKTPERRQWRLISLASAAVHKDFISQKSNAFIPIWFRRKGTTSTWIHYFLTKFLFECVEGGWGKNWHVPH